MSHQITLDPGGASERVIGSGRIDAIEPVRTHTGLSDFVVQVPYDLDLESHASDEIWIEDGSEFLFRGYVLGVENEERDHVCTLSGYGIGYDLTRNETTKTFQNVLVSDAIDTVWGETSFTATVHAPSVTETVTGEQAQEASTTAEFTDIVDPDDTDPIAVGTDQVDLLQTCFTIEGENADRESSVNTSGSDYSDGTAIHLQADDQALSQADFAEWDFTLGYTIPADDFSVQVREHDDDDADGAPAIQWSLIHANGTTYPLDSFGLGSGLVLRWVDTGDGQYDGDGYQGPDLEPGTYTLRVEVTDSDGIADQYSYAVDVVAPYDSRFNHDHAQTGNSFDNTVNTTSGYLDDPRKYPHQVETAFAAASVPWSINEGTLSITANDTTNNQRIQIRLDGGSNWGPSDGTEDNTTSVTYAFGSEKGSGIQGRTRLSSYPVASSAQSATPRYGYNGQSITSWEITFDGDDLPVLNDAEISGSYFDILQELHQRGRMRFWVDHAKASKTATSAERGEVTETLDATVNDRTRSIDLRSYYNHVTLRGQRDADGNRIEATASDATEISTWGQEHLDVDDSTVESQVAADAEVRKLLTESIQERDTTGEFHIVPQNLAAGPSYQVEWSDGSTSTVPAEEVSYSIRAGSLEGTIVFEVDPIDLGRVVPGLRGGVRNAKRGF